MVFTTMGYIIEKGKKIFQKKIFDFNICISKKKILQAIIIIISYKLGFGKKNIIVAIIKNT